MTTCERRRHWETFVVNCFSLHYRISGLPIIMPLAEKLRSCITRVDGRGEGRQKFNVMY
jgi:hypothetical protein